MSQIPNEPYKAPATGGAPAEQQVSGPAIGLMVTAGLGLAMQALSLVMNIAGVGLGAAGGGDEAAQVMLQGTIGIVVGVVSILVGVVVLLGALKMKKLESYGFAMTSAILAMIPCLSPCCLLGLPIGIWAIVILVKPEVKDAFH